MVKALDNEMGVWNISEGHFPDEGSTREKLHFMVGYAVLAPSHHNAQPWIFKVDDDSVSLYADRSRMLPIADPHGREMIIGCGGALFNLRTAIRHFGFEGMIDTFPNSWNADLLAHVRLGEPHKPTQEDDRLFAAIPKRHTNRGPYEERPIPHRLLEDMQEAVRQEGVYLHYVEGEGARSAIADLLAEGDREEWADLRFRREVSHWLHPKGSSDGQSAGYALGVGPMVMRAFDFGAREAARDRKAVEHSPVMAVLGTQKDSPAEWLMAGQALERVLLRACTDGVSASFLNQPVEVARLRTRLRQIAGNPGIPQVVVRMGYGHEISPAPRRNLEDVIIDEPLDGNPPNS